MSGKGILPVVFIIIMAIIVLATLSVLVLRLINGKRIEIDTKTGIQRRNEAIHSNSWRENPVMIFIHGGPASSIGYVTGITSPDMNFNDMKWFLSQMNTQKFFAQNREIMEYAFFGFDVDMLSTTYNVPVYYLAGKGVYAVCQRDVEAYYESIKAPDKAFYWLDNVVHSMFMDNPKLYCDTIETILSKF